MEAKWLRITTATEIYAGAFIRAFVEGAEYRYKIIGPSFLEGFIEVLEFAKNGIAYPTDKWTHCNFAGWVLIENGFEILDEGLSSKAEWPRTLNEAIENLKKALGEPVVSQIRQMSKDDFTLNFNSLGQYIRNQFGLWRGNNELLNDIAPDNPEPDNVSEIIMNMLYEEIQISNSQDSKDLS